MRNGPAGIYLPLNDLIEQHAPHIQMAFDELPWLEQVQTAPDGNMYGIAQVNDDLHGKYGNKTWINRVWLEDLGIEMPTTTDEFADALRAFRTQDPNGNGLQDEIPYSGNVNNSPIPGNLVNAFIPVNTAMNGLYLDDGVVELAYMQPEYRDALAYHNMLYSEGLIDPAAFTQTAEQHVQLGENPGAQLLGASEGLFWVRFSINGGSSGRYRDYDLVPPLIGPDGVQGTSFRLYKVEKDRFVMTSANAYPEVTIKWVDYLYSEVGGYTISYGPEGEGWVRPPAGALGLNGEPALFERLADQPGNTNWGFGNAPRFMPSRIRLGEVRAEGEAYWAAPKLMTRLTGEVQDKYVGNEPPDDTIMPPLYLSEDQTSEVRLTETEIVNYIKEMSVRFVIGELDLERDWSNYIAELERLGVERWLSVYQEAYDAQFGS
jgi:putative aldouronate transport system substrate-binding protein